MFGAHQPWVRVRTDLDDPRLSRPGGLSAQITGSVIGGLIAIGVMIAILMRAS